MLSNTLPGECFGLFVSLYRLALAMMITVYSLFCSNCKCVFTFCTSCLPVICDISIELKVYADIVLKFGYIASQNTLEINQNNQL